ncbi:MAG: hypothetical protein HGA33_05305 [Candidatus Moranbacteria bacterium]|jgi:hypothetical protein|nr:hypothetical protein [Candidatus Moranbacteria bacterium]
MHFATDFNQAIFKRPSPDLEGEILKRIFESQKKRPESLTWKSFEKQGYGLELFVWARDWIYRPEYRKYLEPVEGSIEALRQLCVANDITIVTTRTGASCDLAQQWLFERSGLRLPFVGVGTDGRGVKMSKAPTLLSIKADVYLDNSRKKLMQILRERKEFVKFPKLLHLRPPVIIGDNWSPPHTVPVQSWQHVLHVVNAIVAE